MCVATAVMQAVSASESGCWLVLSSCLPAPTVLLVISPHTHTGGPSRSLCSPGPSQFKFGKRHGEGVMKYRTGQVLARYEGLWEFDVPEGLGKFEYSQDSKVSLVALVRAPPCAWKAS